MCGVEDPPVQRCLLAEEHLTLKKAADIALAMETAAKNAKTLQRPTTSHTGDAHKLLQAGEKALPESSPLLAIIVVVTYHTRLLNVRTRK